MGWVSGGEGWVRKSGGGRGYGRRDWRGREWTTGNAGGGIRWKSWESKDR